MPENTLCEIDETLFDPEVEGWLCRECGRMVCPLCMDAPSETCWPCRDWLTDCADDIAEARMEFEGEVA